MGLTFPIPSLGYDLSWWLVLAIAVLFAVRKLRTTPGWTLPYLAWYGFGMVNAEKPVRAILGIHHTYNNAFAQLLLVVAALSVRVPVATLRRFVRLFIVGVSLLALSQLAGANLPTGIGHGRVYGPLGSPVYLGALLAVAGAWCLPGASWPYWLSVVLALLATQTRGAMLGFGVGLAYLYASHSELNPRRVLLALTLSIPIILGITLSKKQSDSARMSVYRVCLSAIKERQWTGWGLENIYYGIQKHRDAGFDKLYGITSQDHCHNSLIEATAAGGWPGLAITLLTASVMLLLSKPGRHRAAFIVYAAVSMFNPISLTTQIVAALIFASQMRTSIGVPIRPAWLAMLSLAGAMYCSRLALVVSDNSLPLPPRLEAAKKIGVAD